MSSVRVDDVSEILQRGDQVWCKVVNIDDDGKIGLSMKFVNQGNGKDLDPNGVEWQRSEQKKKSMGDKPGKRAIELQAVLNTTCTQCGTKGHLASDCFATPDGKKYELLPEIEDDIVSAGAAAAAAEAVIETTQVPVESSDKLENKVKTKKLKRKKKSKKSKHSKHLENSSSDDSSSQEKKRKKKKKKHSKEAKKRKRKQSESDSDSSDKNKHSKKCKHSRSKYSD